MSTGEMERNKQRDQGSLEEMPVIKRPHNGEDQGMANNNEPIAEEPTPSKLRELHSDSVFQCQTEITTSK